MKTDKEVRKILRDETDRLNKKYWEYKGHMSSDMEQRLTRAMRTRLDQTRKIAGLLDVDLEGDDGLD